MSLKQKGISAERELIHLFWKHGWAASRVAGSGAIKYPMPDIIAGTPTRKIAIESKSTGDEVFYLGKDEVEQLMSYAAIFGAEPWIAIRFTGKKWYFFTPEDLLPTEKSYVISDGLCKRKGLIFEELIQYH